MYVTHNIFFLSTTIQVVSHRHHTLKTLPSPYPQAVPLYLYKMDPIVARWHAKIKEELRANMEAANYQRYEAEYTNHHAKKAKAEADMQRKTDTKKSKAAALAAAK